MNNSFIETAGAIALAIVGVATLAVIVSRNSNTTGVIGATSQAFSQALGTALSPITGGGGNSQFASNWGGLSAGGTFPIS